MTNHVHLLCTAQSENLGVSQMMQSLGWQYVCYSNDNYKQTSTLWAGRFQSSLVCTTHYLLSVDRYIGLNPVRAKMVNDPAQYKWSSYRVNALGQESDLCQPHDIYLQLDHTSIERQDTYRSLFQDALTQALIDTLRACTNKELVLGNDKFKQEIEALIGEKLKTGKMGGLLNNK